MFLSRYLPIVWSTERSWHTNAILGTHAVQWRSGLTCGCIFCCRYSSQTPCLCWAEAKSVCSSASSLESLLWMGVTSEDLHYDGRRPIFNEWLKREQIVDVISSLHSFKIRGGIPSGPRDFDMSRELKHFNTSSSVNVRWHTSWSILRGRDGLSISALQFAARSTEEK